MECNVDESTLKRFRAKYVSSDTGCWVWTASRTIGGYGKLKIGGHTCLAHRVSYEHFVGPIPTDLQLDHLCRVRECVNPKHLEPVTPRINTLRGVGNAAQNATKTHCDNGHEFSPENSYYRPDGRGRQCRICAREVKAKRRRAKSEA